MSVVIGSSNMSKEEYNIRSSKGWGVPVGAFAANQPNYFVGNPPKNPKPDTIYIGDDRQIILIKDGEEIDLFETIKDLKKRLDMFELEIKYIPEGQGYDDAKNNFEMTKEEW